MDVVHGNKPSIFRSYLTRKLKDSLQIENILFNCKMTSRQWSNNQHREMRNDRRTFQMPLGFLSNWAFSLTFFASFKRSTNQSSRRNWLTQFPITEHTRLDWTVWDLRAAYFTGKISGAIFELFRRCFTEPVDFKTSCIWQTENCYHFLLPFSGEQTVNTEGTNIYIKIMGHVRFPLIHSRCGSAICHI